MEIALPIAEKTATSFIINKLLTEATSYLKEQCFWQTNLEEEIKNLRQLLPRIQGVVDFAERKTTTNNESLVEWLWQLRDGIDEAEQVLDYLKYIDLEKKANSDKSNLSKAVGASIRVAKRVLKLEDVLKRLRKCVKNLTRIAQGAGDFISLVNGLDGNSSNEIYHNQQPHPVFGERDTTSLSGSTLFEGRETEKQIIIQTLKEESESNTGNVLVLPLVGMGGIGKTTLAKQVYNHFENVKHFDIRIWICISTNFNVASLTKKILESISADRSDFENLDKLQTKIRENLQGKKFLLVLDDAWDDRELGDWERLYAPLQYGQRGSRILLTTRSSSVVKMVSRVMRGTIKQIDLGGLSNDECRSLLFHYAFANEDTNAHPELTSVGEEITVKLQGVPLLAKTIGGVLNSKLELEHWRSVLTNKLWEMPRNSREDFIPSLSISYSMLSARLKRCFAYCSLFPQDHTFQKRKLVNMWIAAGLIQPQQSEGLEDDIAGLCFDTLYTKSLFDLHPGKKDCYVMHDMLHGLACYVSRHECYRMTPDQRGDIPRNIRHLSVTNTLDELIAQNKRVSKLRYLRTLFIQYDGPALKIYNFIQEMCTSSKNIRVLVIKFYSSDNWWPENIGNFINLRLLDLSEGHISELPESLCRCYFLQVLDIPMCRVLPGGTNRLINLKHFYTRNSTMSKVGKLTYLRELYAYRVGTVSGRRIDELKDMNDLYYLELADLQQIQSSEEVKRAKLQMKTKLSGLVLSWSDSVTGYHNPKNLPSINKLTVENEHEVLAALSPPNDIRELTIMYYRGGNPAPWMSTSYLRSLRYLKIFLCPGWEELPPLWELPHLKHLHLEDMDAVTSFGPEASNSYRADRTLFPSLEELVIENLPRLQEWDDADDYRWFHLLRVLRIKCCLELKKIPCLPLSLEEFDIDEVGLMSLPRSYKSYDDLRIPGRFRELMSLRHCKITSCSVILIGESASEEYVNLLPSSLKQLTMGNVQMDGLCKNLQGLSMLSELRFHSCRGMTYALTLHPMSHLTALQSLHLSDCNDLVSLGGLHSLTSLMWLYIYNCPKLLDQDMADTDNNLLPSSLKRLELIRCNVCNDSLSQYLQGLTSLSTLILSKCPKLLSLPTADILRHLTALQQLDLKDCGELQGLESLGAFASLRTLEIHRCPKLVAPASSSQQHLVDEQRGTKKEKEMLLSLQDVTVESIFYLLTLPALIGIVSVTVCGFEDNFPKINLTPDKIVEWLLQHRESLQVLDIRNSIYSQTLLACMEHLSSLKELRFHDARKLKSVPRMPASLERLVLRDCHPRLIKRCRENVGDDWPNIKHIPFIYIATPPHFQSACSSRISMRGTLTKEIHVDNTRTT